MDRYGYCEMMRCERYRSFEYWNGNCLPIAGLKLVGSCDGCGNNL